MCATDKRIATEKLQVLMFYRLGKKSEKPYGGVGSTPPLPPLVHPRVNKCIKCAGNMFILC